MERNKRASLLIGFGAFLCAVLMHHWMPSGDAPERGRQSAGPGLGGDRAGSSTSSDEPRDTNTVATAEATRSDRPLAVLSDVLSRDVLWQLLDLGEWRAMDSFAATLPRGLAKFATFEAADREQLVARLRAARSVRVRQVLLSTLGALGIAADRTLLERDLDDPALRAASAFALGRLGTEEAIATLLERARDAERTWPAREAYYFGLAQAGLPAIEYLVGDAERMIERKRAPSVDSLLGCVRTPDAWPVLAEIGRRHPEKLIRRMAIHAANVSGRMDPEAAASADFAWLADVAADVQEDPELRGDALRGIAVFDPKTARGLADELLEWRGASPSLVAVALEIARFVGVSDRSVARVVELATDVAASPTRDAALRALAASAQPDADRALAALLPTLDHERRHALFDALAYRGVGPARTPSEHDLAGERALLDAVAALLESGELEDDEQQEAMRLLEGSDAHRERVAELAWNQYAQTRGEAHERRRALLQLAPWMGARATDELLAELEATKELVARVEILAVLNSISESDRDAEVAGVLRAEMLPYLRETLPDSTGAFIATVGPRSRSASMVAITLTNFFGRFGERSDVAMLESLGERFAAEHSRWPGNLTSAMRQSLSEATARATDLIELRGDS